MPTTEVKEVDPQTFKPEDLELRAGRLFRLRFRATDDFGDSVLRHVVAPDMESALGWARTNRHTVSWLPRKIRCFPLTWEAVSETWKESDEDAAECVA